MQTAREKKSKINYDMQARKCFIPDALSSFFKPMLQCQGWSGDGWENRDIFTSVSWQYFCFRGSERFNIWPRMLS